MRKSKDSTGKKREPWAVRTALRIVEPLKMKYEAKGSEKAKNILGDKSKAQQLKTCPKCGSKIKNINDIFCTECGFNLRE